MGNRAKSFKLSDYTGIWLSLLMLIVGVGAYFCFKLSRSAEIADTKDDVLKIVTTISPLYSHVKSVVADEAEVNNLIQPGVSPHDYQFTPDDVKLISDADVLVINGVGLEDWIDDVIDATNNEDLVIIDSSKGVEIIAAEDEDGHEHALGNPHIWLSPQNSVIQIRNIYERLADLPFTAEQSDLLKQNYSQYEHSLLELDTLYLEQLGNVKNKNIAVFHSAYDYLARDYGLNQGVVLEETPGKDPSAQEIAIASQTVTDLGIKTIFKEPQFSPKIVEMLATDLGLSVYEIDPLGDNVSATNYLDIMERNLETLVTALSL